MANYMGTTGSTGAKIKAGMKEALEKYLEGWTSAGEDGDLIKVEGDFLHIYGYDDFNPCPYVTAEQAETEEYKYQDAGEPDWDNADPDQFFKGLVPFLEVSGKDHKTGKEFIIVVQSVGAEKCRFPLGACESILYADGTVEYNTFKH